MATRQRNHQLASFIGLDAFSYMMLIGLLCALIAGGIALAQNVKLRKQQAMIKQLTILGIAEDDLKELVALQEELQINGAVGEQIATLMRELEKIRKNLGLLSAEDAIKKIREQNEDIRKLLQKLKKPPLIELSETDGFSFRSGSAELTISFERSLLEEVIPKIIAVAKQYNVDSVEVVGHTDEVAMGKRRCSGNLDRKLLAYVWGNSNEALKACSNTELGMARAAEITRVLLANNWIRDNLSVIPLSAGQTTYTDGGLSRGYNSKDSQKARRRIEIRMKRSSENPLHN